MKRKLCAALCLACLLLCGCAGDKTTAINIEPPAPYTPTQAAVPASNDIDWNDIPRIWVGRGGPKTNYYDSSLYMSILEEWPVEYDWNSNELDEVNYYVSTATVKRMKNTQLQSRLNLTISREMGKLVGDTAFFDKYITDETRAQYDSIYGYSNVDSYAMFNGNLVTLTVSRNEDLYAYANDYSEMFERSREKDFYATYDMMTSQQLTLSDLFADDVDLSALLNPIIAQLLEDACYDGLARPFRGLPADYPYFTLYDSTLDILFPRGNPYTTYRTTISIPLYLIEPYLAQPISTVEPFLADDTTYAYYYRTDSALELTSPGDETRHAFGDARFVYTPYQVTDALDRPETEALNKALTSFYEEIDRAELPEDLAALLEKKDSYSYANCDIGIYKGFVQLSFYSSVGLVDNVTGDYTYEDYSLYRMFSTVSGKMLSLADIALDPYEMNGLLASNGVGLGCDEIYDIRSYEFENLTICLPGRDQIEVSGSQYLDPDFMTH